MWKEQKVVKLLLLLILLLALWPAACSREDKFVGLYKPLPNSLPGNPEVYLEVKKGGEGIRWVRGNAVVFRWSGKGNEIRFFTQSGGVIVGTLQDKDILVVKLPGPRTVYLKKIK